MAALNGRAEVVRLLVTKYGCPVDYTAHNGCTALLFAASMGHCNVVEVLLSELEANMKACDNNSNTAINLAALHGHSHLLTAPIDKVGVTSLVKSNRPPLHQACSSGHLHVVKILISKYNCDPMAKNHEGLTPLHVAAGSGKMEVVKDLVTKYSCPVDCVDNEGNTPLHSACSSGCSDVVKLLLSKELGAKPDSQNNSGSCAVHIAAFYGHTEVFSVLVDGFGERPEAKDYHNRTALHYAAGGGHLEMVEKLVTKYKCDPMARDDEGLTPIHIAAVAGMRHAVRLLVIEYNSPIEIDLHRDVFYAEKISKQLMMRSGLSIYRGYTLLHHVSWLGDANQVRKLVDMCGANIYARGKDNQTPLHMAVYQGHKDVVNVLVSEFGCCPDVRGFLNKTPLHFASENGHLGVVRELLDKYKCNPMARDDEGLTPLSLAAREGRDKVVNLLVQKYKCPVDCVCKLGRSPLIWASFGGHSSTVRMLVSKFGADPKARDNGMLSALDYASFHGHKKVFDVVVNEYHCSPDSTNEKGMTPLHFACQNGQVGMVKTLIKKHKCSLMARNEDGCTPLHIAAQRDSKEVVKLLVTKYNCSVDCVDSNGDTPLILASRLGHAGTVRVLVSCGVNIEAKDENNSAALFVAAVNGHKDVVSVLIDEFGCSPDSKGPGDQTPLHGACQLGLIDMVNSLINEYKCDRMARNKNGHTPLHLAAAHGLEEIVRVLVTKYSCPVDCVDTDGWTPLMLAANAGHASTVKMLASELGADVEVRDDDNQSSLHHAAYEGHTDVVSVLIEEFGCNPESKGHVNRTPLHAACQGGQMDMVNILINEYKCDLMAGDEKGYVPLHAAVFNGNESVVKALVVNHRCPVDSISNEGNTLTHLATYGGQVSIVKLLTDVFGAFPSIENNDGNTPMDCNAIAALLNPEILTCFTYLYQHGIQQMRSPPNRVLLLGDCSGQIASLFNAQSTYSLPQSHLKENACFLNYVNEDLQDIWMCHYSGKSAYSSMLVQTLMSGNSYTAVCLVNLDKTTDQVIDEVHSQIELIKEVAAYSRKLRTDVIICGVFSAKESHHPNIHEEARRMISETSGIDIIESMSIHLSTNSLHEELEEITPLIRALKNCSKANATKMRYGSVYLLKLLLRDFSDVPCVTLTQLHAHLQEKRILSEDTLEDIHIFLKELDSFRFIMIVGDKKNLENIIIIIHPLVILNKLNNECGKSFNPLIKKGIVAESFLSSLIPRRVATTTVLSLLERFGLPSTKFPLQKVTLDVSLRNTSDAFFFMPHIIADTSQSRKWFLPCDTPFTIGLSLEVVEVSDLFSLKFQYSLLNETAQHFIHVLDNNTELEGHVHNTVWQGGTIWALDDVEILAEVLENGKSIVVMARSNSHDSLKCTNLLSQMGKIILKMKWHHCRQVLSKAYVLNCDTLEKDVAPLATTVPRVEVSRVLHAINNDQEYVTDSSGAKLGRQRVNWFQKFTLKGKPSL